MSRYAIRRGDEAFFKSFRQSGEFPRYRAVFTKDPWEAAHYTLPEALGLLHAAFEGQAQVVKLEIVVSTEDVA